MRKALLGIAVLAGAAVAVFIAAVQNSAESVI